jgi:hypothetical protein
MKQSMNINVTIKNIPPGTTCFFGVNDLCRYCRDEPGAEYPPNNCELFQMKLNEANKCAPCLNSRPIRKSEEIK